MLRMFAEDTPWHVSWIAGVLPQIEEVSRRWRKQTIFTRFMPPVHASDAAGAWRAYYEKWSAMTRSQMPPEELVGLAPTLAALVPPARCFDKATYSPWIDGSLHRHLRGEGITRLVISGGETDVCVLATVLGAVDLGYHATILSDAVCSGADETHDAALKLLGDTFTVQLDVCTTEEFLRTVKI